MPLYTKPSHVGHVRFVYCCGDLWFQYIPFCFHGNACDCAWCTCDSSNKLSIIATIVLQLPYESEPSAKKSVPIPRKMSAHSEEFTLTIPQWPFYDYDISSKNHKIVMWLRPFRTVTLSAAAKTLCRSRGRKETLRRIQIREAKAFV